MAQHYVGGDISLLTKYEEHGAKYYDKSGKPCGDMLKFFSEQGHNAMRVRLFVNPENASATDKGQGVCQDLDYVVKLGKRIKDSGFAFMLDIHYSDSWADPAKQFTPSEWLSLSDEQLYKKIHDYTKDCLQKLKVSGATPDFIQTGNEISYGMLWGKEGGSYKSYYAGKSDNRERFTNLLHNTIKACREECPMAKIILHTERVEQPAYSVSFYNDMKAANIDYDIIGLSYYPYYHGNLNSLTSVITNLETEFPDKKIMIVETGYFHHWQPKDVKYDFSSVWPISDDGQNKFTTALIEALKPHEGKVIGLFWWAMEMNEKGLDWGTQRVTDNWYNAGLFDNETGKATKSLTTLHSFLTKEQQAAIANPTIGKKQYSDLSYNLSGQRVTDNHKGIIIKNRNKILNIR
ncbi:MAG: glycosyl hydrolase 53 family protein [Bacteroidaceae bacterium]|nr:glycosyl hydrolase 53 family protein [Bacteroidaceae bacterium]